MYNSLLQSIRRKMNIKRSRANEQPIFRMHRDLYRAFFQFHKRKVQFSRKMATFFTASSGARSGKEIMASVVEVDLCPCATLASWRVSRHANGGVLLLRALFRKTRSRPLSLSLSFFSPRDKICRGIRRNIHSRQGYSAIDEWIPSRDADALASLSPVENGPRDFW